MTKMRIHANLLLVLFSFFGVCSASAYDIGSIKDNQELAVRAGLMVGGYEVCGLNTSEIVAALNSKFEWLGKALPQHSTPNLKGLFVAGKKTALAEFKPSPRTPCRSQSEVDEGAEIFNKEAESLERTYSTDRKLAATRWLEAQDKKTPAFEFSENQLPSLLKQNPQAQAAFLGAVEKNISNPKYKESVQRHTQRLVNSGLSIAEAKVAACFAALHDAGDWESVQAVMWPLSGKGSYEEALKRAYEVTDPARMENKG